MNDDQLNQKIGFLAEIDALKSVLRQSRIADQSRRENSAEHSWHLAMFALILADDDPSLNVAKIIAMLLIHDVVEIDAEDVPFHSRYEPLDQQRREQAAASRIFGLLPETQALRLLSLWREFEASETAEARFAKALDRFQPLLLNTLTNGGTWSDHHLTKQQVCDRYGPVIRGGSAELWSVAETMIARHFEGQPPRFATPSVSAIEKTDIFE